MPSNERLLSQNASLIFQWLPKEFGQSVPNSEEYPYLQRIVNWAEKEPHRRIYLILNGANLKQKQIKDLEEQLCSIPNIKIVDFNTIELCDDFSLQIGKKERFKISELLKLKYSKNLTDELACYIKQIPFAVVLDVMRLTILKNVERITSRKDAIYMDMDVQPEECQEGIKTINISKNILMADAARTDKTISVFPVENGIIAINEFSGPILLAMISEVQMEFCQYYKFMNSMSMPMDDSIVYSKMAKVISHQIYLECASIPEEEDINRYFSLWEPYIFEKNGGNVKFVKDNGVSSWREGVNLHKNKPMIPLLISGKIYENSLHAESLLKQALSADNHAPIFLSKTDNPKFQEILSPDDLVPKKLD